MRSGYGLPPEVRAGAVRASSGQTCRDAPGDLVRNQDQDLNTSREPAQVSLGPVSR